MVSKLKPTGRAMSMPGGLLAGGIVSLLVTLLCAAILSKMLDSEVLEWKDAGYGIMLLLLLSSMLGTLTASRKIKRQKMLVSLLSSAVYLCILAAITALFFGGQYEAVGVTAMLVFGGSIVIGLLETREGKGRSKGKRVRHHR